jgi:two-component system, NtrC family, response regulator AtoC
MKPQPAARILVVEDDAAIREALEDILGDLGYEIVGAATAQIALEELERRDADIVLTDVKMPGMDGIELCRRLNGDAPHIPVIVMTAFGDVDSAVSALRAGAYDFITKPLAMERLETVLTRALRRTPPSPEMVRFQIPVINELEYGNLIGSSDAMKRVRERIADAAASTSTLLVTGESGTGKELVARAVHEGGERKGGPFVAVSCAAVPDEILESELFGYEKGAFTGAQESRAGLFVQANQGTLFLDEIGDMPLALQPKILRVLQERTVRPVGGSREIPVDARIIAATNRNLEWAVQHGKFREDLYFRVRVLHISLPPLRERGRDVIELAEWFLAQGSDGSTEYCLTREAEKLLMAYHYPGNVRELENCIAAAMALASGGRIGFEELPTGIRAPSRISARTEIAPTSLEEVERRHIDIVLRALDWNMAEGARRLGIDRATLYRKLKRLGIQRPR